MKDRRQILGVDVGLIDSSTSAPDEKWFNVFHSGPTGLTATTSVGRSPQGPAWSWNAGPRHLHCDYGPAEVASEPGPAYPAMIFAAEMTRQQAGCFTIHSACAQARGGGVLLTGGSGAGKTSLALELCSSRGWRFNSADRTSLTSRDGLLVSDGVWPYFRLRGHSFARLAGARTRYGQGTRIDGWQKSADASWDRKLLIHFSELQLNLAQSMLPIAAAYDVKVLEGHQLELRPHAPRDRTFFFAGAVSDNSTGRFAMTDHTGALLGTPFSYTSPAIREQQAQLVEAASKIPFFTIRGSLEAVADFLDKEHNVLP